MCLSVREKPGDSKVSLSVISKVDLPNRTQMESSSSILVLHPALSVRSGRAMETSLGIKRLQGVKIRLGMWHTTQIPGFITETAYIL